jgi:hypothetical protein
LMSAEAVFPRVLLVVYNPTVASEGSRKLSTIFHWNNPDQLVRQYAADLSEASHGYCNYEIVERVEIDGFPIKIDGFRYAASDFISAWRARRGFHNPDWADYRRILADLDIVARVEKEQIDEVWLFAFPYAGFYESRMAGPGAFWCNAPPLEGYEDASRRFIIMGFNYERGVGEMLEAHGHRAESIMGHVFRERRGRADLWERFTRYDKTHPGRAEVGNIHFAPNSRRDYDWGNRETVSSRCDTWYRFPDLDGPARGVNSREWGNGDIRLHHLWWYRHLPHVAGASDGISDNWWEYITNPNLVQ